MFLADGSYKNVKYYGIVDWFVPPIDREYPWFGNRPEIYQYNLISNELTIGQLSKPVLILRAIKIN